MSRPWWMKIGALFALGWVLWGTVCFIAIVGLIALPVADTFGWPVTAGVLVVLVTGLYMWWRS
jgi:hypothetical protein